MEIRDAIGIKTGEKILLSVSAAGDGRIIIGIAKAPEGVESCACSRNAGYAEKKRTNFAKICPNRKSDRIYDKKTKTEV